MIPSLAGIDALLDEVEARHRRARDDLAVFAASIERIEAGRHRRAVALARAVVREATGHMEHEERVVLVPARALARRGGPALPGTFGGVIGRLAREHETLLEMLRELHDTIVPLESAARAREVVGALYGHVQIEDVHLFPRLLRWESSLVVRA